MNYSIEFQNLKAITSGKVVLKPVDLSMTEDLLLASEGSRKELYRFMPWENKSVRDVERFITDSISDRNSGDQIDLAIFEKGTDYFCGVLGLFHLDPFTPKGEVGYWIRSDRSGLGYATDALSTWLAFCRDRLRMARLDACAAVENLASQKVLEKCDFVREGLKPKAELCHGVWHDLILYGRILR